ncbi:MAG: alpha-glucan family phosphorylase [Candidatus Kariarchaeaceae archaeon]|jgi:starch phosphorylase
MDQNSQSKIPERIRDIVELSQNLWWTWDSDGRELFRSLDYPLWQSTGHNAVKMLKLISTERLNLLASDPSFRRLYDSVMKKFRDEESNNSKWFSSTFPDLKDNVIAYFSAEYGLHQSLPLYSGGLGVLSGDTCKEASDLGIPLIGIGFMYPQGYFKQKMPALGWQEADYEILDFSSAPVSLLKDQEGNKIKTDVTISGERIVLQIWTVKVGQVNLYLLDTDLEENKPWHRKLSSRLYGGDRDMRLDQEIVLGIGGLKLIRKLGINPTIWHMNEGHSAFLTIGRLLEYTSQGKSFGDALAIVRNSTFFTTHTPVPAGHDEFDLDLIDQKFTGKWDDLGISRQQFMQMGLASNRPNTRFNMTVLAINTSGVVNGVSQLHAKVTRDMWKHVLDSSDRSVPLIGITNGVHISSWVSGPIRRLFLKEIDLKWLENHDDQEMWKRVFDISDKDFWETKKEVKEALFSFIREKARRHRLNGTLDSEQLIAAGILLDPKALTIGFARRFTTYKRAQLILRDIKRLRKILNDPYKPVQIIFTGKAHPADDPAKHVLQQIYEQAIDPLNGGRIVFLEDYDMEIARYLVQGVDVWLNTPLRPLEASGTSGMKASINGTPNLSIDDGWWAEAYNGRNGWLISAGVKFDDRTKQDIQDATSLYEILEQEVVPMFYDKDTDGIPRKWVGICKEAIFSAISAFSARRMMKEYVHHMYTKADV